MEDNAAKNTMNASKCTNHLANERTYLAWIRTSIGVMAFGFVVERFSFFINQIRLFLAANGIHDQTILKSTQPGGFSTYFGIILIAIGALIAILAAIKFKNVEKQIDSDTYRSKIGLDILLAISIFIIGMLLVFYLSYSL